MALLSTRPRNINFIGNRKKFYTFSCALIAIVLVFCAVFGVKMDVEFKGRLHGHPEL